MDLKSILAANKSKVGKTTSEQIKTSGFDNQDRPYSIQDTQIESNTPFPSPNSESKPEINLISHKGDTKETQRDYKGITPDGLQYDSEGRNEIKKGDTKGLQREHIKGNTKETQREHKGNTKGTPKGTHKGLQREHKVTAENEEIKGTQREHKYSYLRGWNKEIVDLIHDICKETMSKVTYPLTNKTIAETLNIPCESIKTTMQRLKSRGSIIVTEFNDGRGGWSRYTLPEEFFNEIPLTIRVQKWITKGTQKDYKGDTKGNTEGDTITPSSSSNNIYIKTTTTSELPEEWNFDITPYKRFGFTQTQIKQLVSLGIITASDVEQSLIEFVFDLENDSLPTIKKTKVDFLMGLFRKGNKYTSEAYLNDDEATIVEMARRVAEKRDRLLKAKFEAWEGDLSDEEKKQIESKLPTHLMVLHRTYGVSNEEVRKWMFDYFIRNVKGGIQ